MRYPKLVQFIRLLTCFLFLLAVAIQHDARYFGNDLNNHEKEETKQPISRKSDGTIVISTREIAKDIYGYGGNIPLEITIKNERIVDIQTLNNAETPEFFDKVKKKVISHWIGVSLNNASLLQVDAVSGATLSSNATNATIRRAIQIAMNSPILQKNTSKFPVMGWVVLLVVLSGAIIPFFIKRKQYRIIQLALNVIVLGLWSGTFISYSLLINYLSNGINIWQSLIPLMLIVVAFIYPLFNRPSHYCMWLCPLGSLQELAGKSVRYKWKLLPQIFQYINRFHDGLWAVLMLLMWSGFYFRWMDHELFIASLFQQAAWAVIVLAMLFVTLSFMVFLPYCRFVGSTGYLFRITQNPK